MASKDQAIGAVLLIVCILVAIVYIIIIAWPDVILNAFNPLQLSREALQFGAVAAVVLIAFLAIMFIGAWIGWTMATTPPPKPIEELETETAGEEKAAEKKPAESTVEAEEKTETQTETETSTRKRRKKE